MQKFHLLAAPVFSAGVMTPLLATNTIPLPLGLAIGSCMSCGLFAYTKVIQKQSLAKTAVSDFSTWVRNHYEFFHDIDWQDDVDLVRIHTTSAHDWLNKTYETNSIAQAQELEECTLYAKAVIAQASGEAVRPKSIDKSANESVRKAA